MLTRTTDENAGVAVNGVRLSRGGKNILEDVSAKFPPGVVSAILGPNGAGKSTLLKVISGVHTADAGEVCFDGQPLRGFSAESLARRRAFLAQESLLTFDFSVEEVVLLGRIPHLDGWERAGDWRICHWALEAVGMTAFRGRRFPTLSGGEKQRVHLARVLAQLADDEDEDGGPEGGRASGLLGRTGFWGRVRHLWPVGIAKPRGPVPSSDADGKAAAVPKKTRWLLLDEPTSALDLRHQHSVLAMARRFSREFGFGVLVVLHDLNLAMRYADRVVLLNHGKVSAAGETHATLTCERISAVYGVCAKIFCASPGACPFVQTEEAG